MFFLFFKVVTLINLSKSIKREGNKNITINNEIIVPEPKTIPIVNIYGSVEIKAMTKPATIIIVDEVKIAEKELDMADIPASRGATF